MFSIMFSALLVAKSPIVGASEASYSALRTAIAASAPSEAAYNEASVGVEVPNGTLSGTLTIPTGGGPFRAALIIAGSGPTDRNGNSRAGIASNVYAKLAHDLALRGVATLRYDKRGVGASVTTVGESDLRFDTLVDDALALTHLLEADPRFSSVSIIGHSEGSSVGIVAAARDAKIRAFVALEGAGRDVPTVLEEQVRNNPANPPELLTEVHSIDASLLAGKPVPDVDPQLAALFRPSVQPFLISEYAHDPAKDIAQLTVPVLIVQGTTDLQVSLVDARILAKADPTAKLLIVVGMNHLLVDAPADRIANVATYTQPLLALDAHVVPAIADFLP